jgi:DNA polymerase III epsilon subunit-like protein
MIVVDIETSGLDPSTCSILSIGAIDSDNTAYSFYGECKAFDGALIEESALSINGFTQESVRDQALVSEGELYRAFVTFFEGLHDMTLCGHNVHFDASFLKAAAARADAHYPFSHRTIDIHSIAYAHMQSHNALVPLKNSVSALSLSDVAEYVGIPKEPMPHNALTGAKIHAECYARIVYNKKYNRRI